jgi:hypothetical protein
LTAATGGSGHPGYPPNIEEATEGKERAMITQTTTREALYSYQNAVYGSTRPSLAGVVGGLCIWLVAVTVVVTNLV